MKRAIAFRRVEPAAPLVDDKQIADFKPPDARDDCRITEQSFAGRRGKQGFVRQELAGGHRGVHDEWHR
jgi:hypothetical protein